jgi:uncharacterized membrane protein YkoI
MKLFYLSIASVAISLAACSQDTPASKVPSVVLNAVQAKHPGMAVDWEKKKNFYEAEFKMDSVEHTLHIDVEGKLIRHETEIRSNELPPGVLTAIKARYAGYSIDEAARIEQKGQTFYEVELEAKGKKDRTIFFSTDGNIITNS